jgi:hypothetical protein
MKDFDTRPSCHAGDKIRVYDHWYSGARNSLFRRQQEVKFSLQHGHYGVGNLFYLFDLNWLLALKRTAIQILPVLREKAGRAG